MSSNVRVFRCTPDDVFRVLGNGWLFPAWVVGASRMREVDDAWPAVGARLHHSFGTWPAVIDDETIVEEYEHPRRLVIRAKGWPIGEARVALDVKPHGDGCIVRIQEEAIAGPGALIPNVVLDIPLFIRNRETLHRLAYLAEGMANAPDSTAKQEMGDEHEDAEEATESVS